MDANSPALARRPITDSDLPFLQQLYASTRAGELAALPWSEEQKLDFLRMQFEAQHRHYQAHYAGDRFDLLLIDGEPAGRLYVGRWPSQICVIDISLLPAHRGSGIGTRLLTELIEEAQQQGKAVSVHVEKLNPARRLYLRLGFAAVEDLGIYERMEREPEVSALKQEC